MMTADEASDEIGRLVTRIVTELAPIAGLQVSLTVRVEGDRHHPDCDWHCEQNESDCTCASWGV